MFGWRSGGRRRIERCSRLWSDAFDLQADGRCLRRGPVRLRGVLLREEVKYHLDYQTLRKHRPRFECRRLILTHMSQEMLDRVREAEFECAEAGRVVTL